MRINAAISLQENDIIGQSNQEVSNHVAEHLAQEIARQIAVFVRKEMIINRPGPSMHDPFSTVIQFSIEAELNESNNRRRKRENRRMRTMMSTPTSVGTSPFHDMHARERSERMRGVYTPDVYNGDPLAKPATVQRFEDDQRAAAMESAYRTRLGESSESAFRQQYMLAIDPATEDGDQSVEFPIDAGRVRARKAREE